MTTNPKILRSLRLVSVFVLWIVVCVLGVLFGSTETLDQTILFELRIPRVILSSAVGAGLALAGLLLQALFSNPLCDPYTMGISAWSAVGAVLGLAIGIPQASSFSLTAILGGLACLFFLFGFAASKKVSLNTFVLAGVMLGFLGSGLLSIVLVFSDQQGLQNAILWLMGDLSRAQHGSAVFLAGVVVVFYIAFLTQHKALDVLMLGEEFARSVGLETRKTRTLIVIASSFLVSFCVSSAGIIGFIGLVVPHLFRRAWGGGSALHRHLIPLCGFGGAAFLVGSDLISRVLDSSMEIPVGIITSILGAPLFLFLLLKDPRLSR